MKKLFVLFVALITLVVVAGCNGNREFAADGEFTAYATSIHRNAPMVTTVTVTIEKDEIVGYYIDAKQGSATQTAGADTPDDTSDDTWAFAWNEKTKKELGDDYGMVANGGAIAEWYEQAALIEAFWLENGYDAVTVGDDEVIDNVAGVTIKDGGYIALAAEAVQLAKDGKMQAVLTSSDDLYIAHMLVDKKGNFSELTLDVLQGSPDGGTFAWNEKTKQALGDDYGMKGVGGSYTFTDGAWVASDAKASLEWYEQAKLITDYVTENGWNEDLAAIASRGGTIDGTTLIDDLAGVTIRSQSYYDVLAKLFDKLPE
jgi:major membrane immunogen (membrane-anchored lipoprotein)